MTPRGWSAVVDGRPLSAVPVTDDDGQFRELRAEHGASLARPPDDMWASFADASTPYLLSVDGDLAGTCSIDDDGQAHRFYVRPDREQDAESLFALAAEAGPLRSATLSTADPPYLSLGLTRFRRFAPVAVLYQHRAPARVEPLPGLRTATADDREAAVEFSVRATSGSEPWTRSYLTIRIDRGELLLHERDGTIVASGECRADERIAGYAHLGLIVGPEHRGQGLGSRLLSALVEVGLSRDLIPLCSTEPANRSAQHAIRQAGFRANRWIYRGD